MENQYELAQEIVNATGISIVTCGMCGQVMLHRIEDVELKCNECGFESESSDFPDLFYK